MVGFCTKCGRPLPENGICPCTLQQQPVQPQDPQPVPPPQQPQQAQQPQYQQPPYQQQRPVQQGYVAPQYNMGPSRGDSAFVTSLKNLPNLFIGYFRDPVGTARLAYEKRDQMVGWIMLGVTFLLSLFGTLFFALIHIVSRYYPFGLVAARWFLVSLLGPIAAFGITIGLYYALAGLAKKHLDFTGVVALFGVNCILPALLLAASMLLSMISPVIFEIFAILICATWVVVFFTTVFQVLGVKMNIINTLVLIGGLAVASYVVVLLLKWFAVGQAATLLLPFFNLNSVSGYDFGDLGDLFGSLPWG